MGIIGGDKKRFRVSMGLLNLCISAPWLPDVMRRTHGCRWVYTPSCTTIVRATSCLAAGSDKAVVCGPEPHDDAHRCATGRTADRERWRGGARWRRVIAGASLPPQQAEGRGRDGTAGMEKAAMADFHTAIGHDRLQAPAETRHDVEVGGAWACTAHFTGGEGDRAVRERDKAAVGDGAPADRGGEGGARGGAVVLGLAMAIPGESPRLRSARLQTTSGAHVFCEARAVKRGEGVDRDNAGGAGWHPRCAVRCAPPTRDDGRDGGGAGVAGPTCAEPRGTPGGRSRHTARRGRAA